MKKSLLLLLLSLETHADILPPPVCSTEEIPAYSRSLYGSWVDKDKDCQNTRTEVLIRDSLVPPVLTDNGCYVVSGLWVDKTTAVVTTNPRQLDIDHAVSLKEAHVSGAHTWERSRKRDFANDQDNLLTMMKGINRSKGDKNISEWMPSNRYFWNTFIVQVVTVKNKYGLQFSPAERLAIHNLLRKGLRYSHGDKQATSCLN